jgi:hypothetical protein
VSEHNDVSRSDSPGPPEQLATSFELWAEYFRHLAGVCYAGIGGVVVLAQVLPPEALTQLGIAAFILVGAAIAALMGTEQTLQQVDEWTPLPQRVRRLKDISSTLIFLAILIVLWGAIPTEYRESLF